MKYTPENSVLAHRLATKTRTVHTIGGFPLDCAHIWMFPILMSGGLFVEISYATALIVSMLCAFGVLATWRVDAVEDIAVPIAEEFPVWLDLVAKLANSPCDVERESIFLGTICEEFEE